MTHWSDAWLGRLYDEETYNCSHFLAEVLSGQFGLDLNLPDAAASLRGRDRQVAQVLTMRCAPVQGERHEGDIVLALAHGRRAEVGHHSGVLVLPGSEPMVLHCMAGMGSCRHPLSELPARGLIVHGVYRWLT